MISVTMIGAQVYEVIVEGDSDDDVETMHTVSMTNDAYHQLCDGKVTHEYVLVQAFRFLLEREANTQILREFDITEISRYFPEFEAEMKQRLAG